MPSIDIVKHYGSDLSVEGLKTRYKRFTKPDIQLFAEAVCSGTDAKLVTLSCDSNDRKGRPCFSIYITRFIFVVGIFKQFFGLRLLLKASMDIVKLFGCGLNRKALENFLHRHIRPEANLIKEAVANGQEPPELGTKGSQGQSCDVSSSSTAPFLSVTYILGILKPGTFSDVW
jgi:hypothetical protein